MKYMEDHNIEKSTTLSAHRWENTVSTAWNQAQKTNLKMYFIEKKKKKREWTNIQQDNFLKRKQKKSETLRKLLPKVQLASPLKSREGYKNALTQKKRFKYNSTMVEHCGLRVWW